MADQQGISARQASTHGKLQNSSHYLLRYVNDHDWKGHVNPEHPYPRSIESGKSGEFVHDGNAEIGGPTESEAAVVYQGGQNIPGGNFLWVVAWSNKPGFIEPRGPNKVYTEIFEIELLPSWETIKTKLENSTENPATYKHKGYSAVVTISEGTGTSANLEATITKLIG